MQMRLSIFETEIPPERALEIEARRFCDVCMLGIQKSKSCYCCNVCNAGDFDICSDCFDAGAVCLDAIHSIQPRKTIAPVIPRVKIAYDEKNHSWTVFELWG